MKVQEFVEFNTPEFIYMINNIFLTYFEIAVSQNTLKQMSDNWDTAQETEMKRDEWLYEWD